MGHALYRKYRSKTFDEVVGQDHITTTLKNALKTKTFSHAYLFTGPKGVGKTSIARILAHEVSNLPYNEESTHLDIIEIDAASNRRIDEIRDLRDKVHIAPSSAKYKVYIIDEVHMLTKEAFNALLKTLEEPPAHVIFILATTELSKLPETIISRTQHFTFNPISNSDTVRHLRDIATREGFSIEDEALSIIADNSAGSFRDSISLLDKLKTGSEIISADYARASLGIAPQFVIEKISELIHSGTPGELTTELQLLREQGYSSDSLCKQLAKQSRHLYLSNHDVRDLETYKKLTQVPSAFDSETMFEITILEAQSQFNTITKAYQADESNLQITTPKQSDVQTTSSPSAQPKYPAKEITETRKQSINPKRNISNPKNVDGNDDWQKILNVAKKQHPTLYSVLRMCHPIITDTTIKLEFNFPFHYKQINEKSKLRQISDIAEEVTGIHRDIECNISSNNDNDNTITDNLSTITNIFGPSEVLES